MACFGLIASMRLGMYDPAPLEGSVHPPVGMHDPRSSTHQISSLSTPVSMHVLKVQSKRRGSSIYYTLTRQQSISTGSTAVACFECRAPRAKISNKYIIRTHEREVAKLGCGAIVLAQRTRLEHRCVWGRGKQLINQSNLKLKSIGRISLFDYTFCLWS